MTFFSQFICFTYIFVQVCALTSWDSSIHDSLHLNRVTPDNERVYLILKTVVRLSHPAAMELVLRKRICINVYKRQSISERLKKRIGKAVSRKWPILAVPVPSCYKEFVQFLAKLKDVAQILYKCVRLIWWHDFNIFFLIIIHSLWLFTISKIFA